jgi:hypothetical protein
MFRIVELYLRTEHGVEGPFSRMRLQRMAEEGIIGPDVRVSADRRTWWRASEVQGLLPSPGTPAAPKKPDYVPSAVDRPELADLMKRVDGRLVTARRVFPVVVAASVVGGLLGTYALAQGVLYRLGPAMPGWLALMTAFDPSALLALAAGHLAGQWCLRAACGLSEGERKCLALYIPHTRAPHHWPGAFRNWIYGGDWLSDSRTEELFTYTRAFLVGSAPESIEEELEIWTQLYSGVGGGLRGGVEAGHAVRELACLEKLPSWARHLEPGTTLPDLLQRLGRAGRSWAEGLLRRAAVKHPAFRAEEGGACRLAEARFEFHYCLLRNGREALVVMIRPAERGVRAERTARPVVEAAA